ncbi:MAG: hypothetical protein AAGC60_28470 [Acidobacteriota bacterium]
MNTEIELFVQTLMTSIAPFLPWLSKGAEKAIEEVGEQAGAEIWKTVQPALERRPAVREAAYDLAADRKDSHALAVVSHQLRKALLEDPALLAKLQSMVAAAPAPDITASVVGNGAIGVGRGSVVSGAGGTSVGGGVSGDVVIGGRPPSSDRD